MFIHFFSVEVISLPKKIVAVNIHVQVFVSVQEFSCLGYIARKRIAESCSTPLSLLNSQKSCQTVPQHLHHFIHHCAGISYSFPDSPSPCQKFPVLFVSSHSSECDLIIFFFLPSFLSSQAFM